MTSSPNTAEGAAPPPLGRTRVIDGSLVFQICLAVAAAVAVAWLKGPVRVVEIVLDYLGFLAVLGPKIYCGFFIAAAVPLLISRETLTRWLGQGSGLSGLMVASLAGALVPGGPMMIFPLAAGFRAAGASLPILITFVTAWSLYGINRTLIWEMSFLHADFVALRVAICLPLPLVVGWVAQRVMR